MVSGCQKVQNMPKSLGALPVTIATRESEQSNSAGGIRARRFVAKIRPDFSFDGAHLKAQVGGKPFSLTS